MPFKSAKQRKFMFSKHPEIAERWRKEGKANVEGKGKKGKKKRARLTDLAPKKEDKRER